MADVALASAARIMAVVKRGRWQTEPGRTAIDKSRHRMYNTTMEQTFTERLSGQPHKKHGGGDRSAEDRFLSAMGGETLAGSGFEDEEPEAGFISDSDTAL